MFSINPAYDVRKGEMASGEFDEREELYRYAEKLGVGITVMKQSMEAPLSVIRPAT